MHKMPVQPLAQLLRIADRLAVHLSDALHQGRPKLRNVALATSRVDIYGGAMDQVLCNEGPGDPIGKRDARIIAVVDDDKGFRDALQFFLRTFEFHVEAFASGDDFLRSSRLDAVGCVVLDLAMPEMSGLEVQQQLAARGLQIPIVFVTAHRDEDLGQRASEAGALAVLRKPVDDEELVHLVREALRGQ
jgi:CheY-like chemotaxis protein